MKPPSEAVTIALIGPAGAVIFAGSNVLREFAAVSDWPLAGPVEGISYCVTCLLGVLCIAFPFGCSFLFLSKRRVLGLKLVLAFLGGWVGTVSAGVFREGILRGGAERLALRSRPLIEAIRKYESVNARPPEYLEKLTPEFISEIPRTSMSGCPDFSFKTLDETNSAYGLNRWYLRVKCDRGNKNYDTFLFLPDVRYDDVRLGGPWERVQDWAYTHEWND
jgi:hypothetical protein